jgi:YggT family protein
MFSNALIFLIETAFGLFIVALLLRFYLQWARAPYRNPLSAFLQALTDFMVKPARRVVPGLWGLDLATFVLAWILQIAEQVIVLQLRGYETGPNTGLAFVSLLLLALVILARISLYILMVGILAQVVLSWVSPHSPVMPLLNSLTRPFLRPFQRHIPPVGNVDLSPLFALVAIQLLLMLPVAWLEAAVTGLSLGR